MTQMRDIDELLPEVMLFAPSLPEPVALRFIRDAARELCERTRIWKELDSFPVSEPGEEYLCTIPDAQIIDVENPRLDGTKLTPAKDVELDERYGDWAEMEGAARFITQLRPNTLTLVPRQTGTLSLRLVLKPSERAEQLPEFLVTDYATTIGKGAAGRAMTLPNAEYANPQLGAAYVNEFVGLLDSLAPKVRRGQQRAHNNTRASFF